MGKVIYDISMSLDGFITAANVRPEAGLGDDGERLHDWAFNSADPRNRELLAKGASLGAIISGRHNYDLAVPYWQADGPTGDARVPTVVVSHSVPKDIPDGGVYRFADGIETALEEAQKAQVIKILQSWAAGISRRNSSNTAWLMKSRSTSSLCSLAAAFDCSSTWA